MKFKDLKQLDRIEYLLLYERIKERYKLGLFLYFFNFFLILIFILFSWILILYVGDKIDLLKTFVEFSIKLIRITTYILIIAGIIDLIFKSIKRKQFKKLNKRFNLNKK